MQLPQSCSALGGAPSGPVPACPTKSPGDGARSFEFADVASRRIHRAAGHPLSPADRSRRAHCHVWTCPTSDHAHGRCGCVPRHASRRSRRLSCFDRTKMLTGILPQPPEFTTMPPGVTGVAQLHACLAGWDAAWTLPPPAAPRGSTSCRRCAYFAPLALLMFGCLSWINPADLGIARWI